MRRRFDRVCYWLRVFLRSLPFIALLSCGGAERGGIRAADDVVIVACLEVERRIAESPPTSRAEDEAKIAGARLACDIVREHIAGLEE